MRKVRTESEWKALFREQSKTGKSVQEFCQQAGIHPRQWYRKRKEYEPPTRFIQLEESVGAEGNEIRIAACGVLIHTGLYGRNGLAVVLGAFGRLGDAGL